MPPFPATAAAVRPLLATLCLSAVLSAAAARAEEVVASIAVPPAGTVTVLDTGEGYAVVHDGRTVFAEATPSVQVLGVHLLSRGTVVLLRTTGGSRQTPLTYRMLFLTPAGAVASPLAGTGYVEPFGTQRHVLAVSRDGRGERVCLSVPDPAARPREELCVEDGNFLHQRVP